VDPGSKRYAEELLSLLVVCQCAVDAGEAGVLAFAFLSAPGIQDTASSSEPQHLKHIHPTLLLQNQIK
jgi:hypothetical protein